jgi:hypothetical protein
MGCEVRARGRVFLSASRPRSVARLAGSTRQWYPARGFVAVSPKSIAVRFALRACLLGLCLTFLFAVAALALAASPRVTQQDLVTNHASSVPSANAWGANGDRLVRARNGDLYTTYVKNGTDSEHFRWVLARRRARGARWSVVTSGLMAHQPGDPPEVLISRSGTVFVITISPWDSAGAGAPQIWDSRSRRQTTVGGHWLTGHDVVRAGSLYPVGSIDAKGDIAIWENVPCPYYRFANGQRLHCRSVDVPGTVYWAYRKAGSRTWHSVQWVSPYRYAYDFLLPHRTDNGFDAVGTRDILQAPFEAPYRCPNGTDYCFDQVAQARFAALGRRPTLLVARPALDSKGYSGDHRASAEDAYIDARGATHVLLSVVDAGTRGTYENRHVVISPTGTITDVTYAGILYPNFSRIVQDPSGRFWIYSVGPDPNNVHRCEVFIAGSALGSTDGTQLAAPTVIPLSRRYDCAHETRNYDATPRSGTGPARFIDGVLATNGGADWVHYRIALPAN